MIEFMKLPASDAERLCYAEGFTQAAQLFARIADLQRALGESTATLTAIADGPMTAKQAQAAAREGLNQ